MLNRSRARFGLGASSDPLFARRAMEELDPLEEARSRHEPACAGLRALDRRAAPQRLRGFPERLDVVRSARGWIERAARRGLAHGISEVSRNALDRLWCAGYLGRAHIGLGELRADDLEGPRVERAALAGRRPADGEPLHCQLGIGGELRCGDRDPPGEARNFGDANAAIARELLKQPQHPRRRYLRSRLLAGPDVVEGLVEVRERGEEADRARLPPANELGVSDRRQRFPSREALRPPCERGAVELHGLRPSRGVVPRDQGVSEHLRELGARRRMPFSPRPGFAVERLGLVQERRGERRVQHRAAASRIAGRDLDDRPSLRRQITRQFACLVERSLRLLEERFRGVLVACQQATLSLIHSLHTVSMKIGDSVVARAIDAGRRLRIVERNARTPDRGAQRVGRRTAHGMNQRDERAAVDVWRVFEHQRRESSAPHNLVSGRGERDGVDGHLDQGTLLSRADPGDSESTLHLGEQVIEGIRADRDDCRHQREVLPLQRATSRQRPRERRLCAVKKVEVRNFTQRPCPGGQTINCLPIDAPLKMPMPRVEVAQSVGVSVLWIAVQRGFNQRTGRHHALGMRELVASHQLRRGDETQLSGFGGGHVQRESLEARDDR